MKKRLVESSIIHTVVFMILVMFAVLLAPTHKVQASGDVKIHAIYLTDDKGSSCYGDAVLLEDDGQFLLMDTGRGKSSKKLVSYLESLGVTELSVYISHFHEDHIGGFDAVAENFKINHIYLPSTDCCKGGSLPEGSKWNGMGNFDDIYSYIGDVAANENAEITMLKRGSKFSVGAFSFHIIGPICKANTKKEYKKIKKYYNYKKYGKSVYKALKAKKNGHSYMNNMSLSAMITVNGVKYLSMGDTDTEMEKIITAIYNVKTDILKLSHHGRARSSTTTFLKEAKPTYAFACADDGAMESVNKTISRVEKINKITVATTNNERAIIVYQISELGMITTEYNLVLEGYPCVTAMSLVGGQKVDGKRIFAAGDPITVKATVKNTGLTRICMNKSSTLKLYEDTKNANYMTLALENEAIIEPGESVELTFTGKSSKYKKAVYSGYDINLDGGNYEVRARVSSLLNSYSGEGDEDRIHINRSGYYRGKDWGTDKLLDGFLDLDRDGLDLIEFDSDTIQKDDTAPQLLKFDITKMENDNCENPTVTCKMQFDDNDTAQIETFCIVMQNEKGDKTFVDFNREGFVSEYEAKKLSEPRTDENGNIYYEGIWDCFHGETETTYSAYELFYKDEAGNVMKYVLENDKWVAYKAVDYNEDNLEYIYEIMTVETPPSINGTVTTLNHRISKCQFIKKATVFKTGTKVGTCNTCGEEVTVTIPKLDPTLRLSSTKKSVKKKKSCKLKISGLARGDSIKSVKISKKSVATVKKVKKNRYKITGKKKGKATVTVTLKSGMKATCKVTVK